VDGQVRDARRGGCRIAGAYAHVGTCRARSWVDGQVCDARRGGCNIGRVNAHVGAARAQAWVDRRVREARRGGCNIAGAHAHVGICRARSWVDGQVRDARRGIRLSRSSDLEMIRGAGDRQRASVMGEVAGRTQDREVQGIVAAAVGAMDQVMQLQSAG